MAEKKKPMGDDPLAWLSEGDVEPTKAKPKKAAAKRTRTRRVSHVKKTQVELIEESFGALVPQSEDLAVRFYERLFTQHPETNPLFGDASTSSLQKNLLAALLFLVQNQTKPEALKDYIFSLSVKHAEYNKAAEYHPIFVENLLEVMAEFAGKAWTKDVQQAWQDTLNIVTTIMLEAYQPTEADEMEKANSKQTTSQEIAMMRSAINGSMIATMMIDRNFNITYINDATLSMLKPYEKTLKGIFPDFNLKKLVGSNIDIFHKDPSHQRELLADPANLPINTDIQVGPLSFNLNVTAMIDDDDNYLGNTLEWANVTEVRVKEIEIARLQSAVEGATSALMICDADRVITFANPSVMKLLENRLPELRKIFPKLELSKVVGTCIDDFHKDPSLQKGILQDLDNLPYRNQIQLLDIHFDLNATAIVDADGNYMGNMVEWKDITDQVNAEEAIQGLIKAAQVGQLEERIETANYDGFMKSIADGVNNIMDAVLAPVKETIAVSEALSEGNLAQKMDGDYQGMFGDLADALNSTIEKLAETMEEINESADSISTAATEISEGNLDLSQRTESQASSLEETASSMEELTSTVRQNSDNARQANQLAASSREQAEKGGSVIKEAIDAMTAISSSSKKVTDIIGVIDEIAFQTNLLALNAAVEAARAGEQGRGFAVVASEVRNLAQRSASAAKEIKELINDSGEKVKEGSMLVDESGRTLEEIVASSKKVGDIISEIAAAGSEQTQGIEQVNKAVGQMDEMTQQNAALVEEAAAASESLDEQGRSLQKLISFFDVGVSLQDEKPAVKAKAASKKAKPVAKKTKPAAKKAKAVPKPAPVSSQDDDEWDEF